MSSAVLSSRSLHRDSSSSLRSRIRFVEGLVQLCPLHGDHGDCACGDVLLATARDEKPGAVFHILALWLGVSLEGSLWKGANDDLTCLLHAIGLLIHGRGVCASLRSGLAKEQVDLKIESKP